ncbi:oxidoreductase [Apiospora aurea]|uniref:Oxidoreductase n=1 Tax=Apiospora aurea TaxID=335848 RepID=A0ABR1Q0P1_9PEZI
MAPDSFRTPGVAVLIGSASGIGKATALAYARNGARGLILADFNEPGVQKTAAQAKQEATHEDFAVLTLRVDVRDYVSVENVFEEGIKKFGRIDYSVTAAGIFVGQGFLADNPLDLYDDVQETNAKGVLHHTKAAIRVMLKQEPLVIQDVDRARIIGRGAIVNICSIAGLVSVPGNIEYVASKFAAVGITKTAGFGPTSGRIDQFMLPFLLPRTNENPGRLTLMGLPAGEYGSSQIRINAVCPGAIETPLLERALALAPESRTAFTNGASLKRVGDVEEVADAILFLTSNAGSFLHGSSMTVDGGYANNGPI